MLISSIFKNLPLFFIGSPAMLCPWKEEVFNKIDVQ
jgi:hypothetical protein